MLKVLRVIFVDDYRTKLTALFLAVVIWVIVFFEVTERYVRDDIELKIVATENGKPMEDVWIEPSKVRVRGEFRCPRRIGESLFSRGVPINGVRSIEQPAINVPYRIDLSLEDFGLPSDVHVIKFEPSYVEVRVLRLMTKRLRVIPDFVDSLPEGYKHATPPEVRPMYVTVRGPRKVLEQAETIKTEPISLRNRRLHFSVDAGVSRTVGGARVECGSRVVVSVWPGESDITAAVDLPLRIQVPPDYPHTVVVKNGITAGNMVKVKLKGPQGVLSDPSLLRKSRSTCVYVEIDPAIHKLREPGARDVPYRVPLMLLAPDFPELRLADEPALEVLIKPADEKEKKP